MPRTPTVMIQLTASGQLIVEAPGKNGARQKIEGLRLADLPAEMTASLLAQRDSIAAEEAEQAADLKRRIAGPMAQAHGRNFTNRIVHDVCISPTGRVYTDSEWTAEQERRLATKAEATALAKSPRKSKAVNLALAINIEL